MDTAFTGPRNKVLLGLKFGDGSQQLIRSLKAFCEKTGMTSRIVHVLDEFSSEASPYPDVFRYDSSPSVMAAKEKAFYKADRDLYELVRAEGLQEPYEIRVVLNYYIASSVLAEAEDCSLIITGAHENVSLAKPKSFSIVWSLLSGARLPVLVIKNGATLDFAKAYRLMILDDMSAAAQEMVWTALAFGIATGADHVLHVHFHEASEKEGAVNNEMLRERAVRYAADMEVRHCRYCPYSSNEPVTAGLDHLGRDFHPTITAIGKRATERFLMGGSARRHLSAAIHNSRALLLLPS